MTLRAADRALLVVAAVAVAIAAADTYVVVLALPEMSAAAGIEAIDLQRAAPIISGFLLGYVAMLPLIGRVADLEGRVPVLVLSLAVFAVGSGVTALAYDLPGMVAGRFLQGVGGGGLVPATMALVADLYPVHRRGLPLGLVSAVQELGSVLGPVLGAAVLAVATWRGIFALNLAAGVVLLLATQRLARRSAMADARTAAGDAAPVAAGPAPPRRHLDAVSVMLALLVAVAGALTALQPSGLVRHVVWGELFAPYVGESRWLAPVGLLAVLGLVALLAWSLLAPAPLLDLRRWGRALVAADLPGALLLAVALGGVILAFGTGDPEIQVFSDQGHWYLLGSAIALGWLVVHLRRSARPLVPRGALAARGAWGGLLVSLFVGAALIAAVVALPIFARTTVYPDSQLLASLVLVRLLAALPVGAVLGGLLLRHVPAGVVAGAGMAAAAVGFVVMARWDASALEGWGANVPLLLTGLGFGLALAPVNAVVLASTDDTVHGLASAMVVVARMVGMLVGISALTTLGLRAFYAERDALPAIDEVCGRVGTCDAYKDLLRDAALTQEQVVFAGAAVCAAIAALLALALFRGADTRGAQRPGLLVG
ncbi:MFS transporter [Nocardioides sp. ChNu-153]|uniref:MFS transporter n=1 Tax=unclassified Nocardioides TaxID=2615069 RepID=UPI002406BB1C|nr:MULTISPECIES: MFS transporter [unclassified Nocardioides]MDF9715573.1 MFS transporter [Nocardioides sp. ChNu-99]MDN7121245.1 MFS transporter [Nocardioides sp. ChNu-153]